MHAQHILILQKLRSSLDSYYLAVYFLCDCYFLGGYDKEEKAARAYDLAALKYWGPTTTTNFPVYIMHACHASFLTLRMYVYYIR